MYGLQKQPASCMLAVRCLASIPVVHRTLGYQDVAFNCFSVEMKKYILGSSSFEYCFVLLTSYINALTLNETKINPGFVYSRGVDEGGAGCLTQKIKLVFPLRNC